MRRVLLLDVHAIFLGLDEKMGVMFVDTFVHFSIVMPDTYLMPS